MNGVQHFAIPARHRMVAGLLILVGAAAAALGLRSDPARAWANLLLNGFYITSLALSALFFLATQRASGARWSASLRRVPEGFMLTLPVAAVLMLLTFIGRGVLYAWGQLGGLAHAPSFAGSVQYLQPELVFARAVIAFSLWTWFAWFLRGLSLQQDRDPLLSLSLHHRLTRYSVLFLPLFAVTFTWTAFDWLLSLEPEWFSTMFAIYIFAGTFVQGIAAITLATVLLSEHGLLAGQVSEGQLHDLGKMLFAFSTFWAYIWVCQYLLIWYGNIPEEVTHYLKRTSGPWLVFFVLNFVVNWLVPFVVLLSARSKRQPTTLKTISVLLLCGHWLDLYVLIMPSVSPSPKLGIRELLVALGYVAVAYLLFADNLAQASLVPVNDPILAAESTEEEADYQIQLLPESTND